MPDLLRLEDNDDDDDDDDDVLLEENRSASEDDSLQLEENLSDEEDEPLRLEENSASSGVVPSPEPPPLAGWDDARAALLRDPSATADAPGRALFCARRTMGVTIAHALRSLVARSLVASGERVRLRRGD